MKPILLSVVFWIKNPLKNMKNTLVRELKEDCLELSTGQSSMLM